MQPESAPQLGDLTEQAGTEVTVTTEVDGLVGDNAFALVRQEGAGAAEPLLTEPLPNALALHLLGFLPGSDGSGASGRRAAP